MKSRSETSSSRLGRSHGATKGDTAMEKLRRRRRLSPLPGAVALWVPSCVPGLTSRPSAGALQGGSEAVSTGQKCHQPP